MIKLTRSETISLLTIGIPTIVLAFFAYFTFHQDSNQIESPVYAYIKATQRQLPQDVSKSYRSFASKFNHYKRLRYNVKNGKLTQKNIPYNIDHELTKILFDDDIENFIEYLGLNGENLNNPYALFNLNGFASIQVHNDSGFTIENITLDIPKAKIIEIKKKDKPIKTEVDKSTIELGSLRPQEQATINIFGSFSISSFRMDLSSKDPFSNNFARQIKLTHKQYTGLGTVMALADKNKKESILQIDKAYISRIKWYLKDFLYIFIPLYILFFLYKKIKKIVTNFRKPKQSVANNKD